MTSRSERGLPSLNPAELEIPDTPRVRDILECFAHKSLRHAKVYNEHGEVTQLLSGLAARYHLDLRVLDLGRVNSLDDVLKQLGVQPGRTGFSHTALDSPDVNFVINGLDQFILGNPQKLTRGGNLDAAMHPLTIAAQNAGVMVITHPLDYETYMKGTNNQIARVVLNSHWLSEFYFRRFTDRRDIE